MLSGELMRAILKGGRYPAALLADLVMRIRTDHYIDRLRVSLIKAAIVGHWSSEKPGHPLRSRPVLGLAHTFADISDGTSRKAAQLRGHRLGFALLRLPSCGLRQPEAEAASPAAA